jgi:hypothetical protein
MQKRVSAWQTQWREYPSCFDFDILYVKGQSNKVADALSRYYQFDLWDEAPLVQHYVFSDIRLDPDHEDLPWERSLKIKNRVIEKCAEAAQCKRIMEQLKVLRERLRKEMYWQLHLRAELNVRRIHAFKIEWMTT